MRYDDDDFTFAQTVQFITAVEEECRRWGGKHLLTHDEYLTIIQRYYHELLVDAARGLPTPITRHQ